MTTTAAPAADAAPAALDPALHPAALALWAPLIGQPGGRHRLPTPALLLDLDAAEHNIDRMAARARSAGLALRPHAKSHKCAAMARLQIAAGAVGQCCAKLGEAEALAAAGVRGLLITSPLAGADQFARVARLAAVDATLQLVVDHPQQVALAQAACAAAGQTLRVLVDVDVGLGRTGVADVATALAIATAIGQSPALRLVGVQGYGGHWQHLEGATTRAAAVRDGMGRLRAVVEALRAAGHAVPLITGGGTGSFSADAALGLLTEVQPGSYVFMDRQYRDALRDDDDGAFRQSLWVQARVISVQQAAHVTVDAGLKAFATDGPLPQPAPGRFGACSYHFFGDEHGRLSRPSDGVPVALDERVELVPPHCDPTVDRYHTLVLVRGDRVVGLAPLEAARRAQ